MGQVLQDSLLTAVILFTVSKVLLEYPSVSQFERFVEAAEKNETSKFSRNCVSCTSFAPLTEISTGTGLFEGPPPAIPISGRGAHLARVAKESETAANI